MKLALGVIDLPYVAQKPLSAKGTKSTPDQTTTGKVAAILEAKYGVMGAFYELHQQDIAEALAISMQETLEALMMGAPASIDPFGAAMSETEQLFRTFLDDKEIEVMGIAGVPTQASLDGVNHRMKIKKGEPRPSFVDTGLYQSSFKAWIK